MNHQLVHSRFLDPRHHPCSQPAGGARWRCRREREAAAAGGVVTVCPPMGCLRPSGRGPAAALSLKRTVVTQVRAGECCVSKSVFLRRCGNRSQKLK